MSLSVFLLIPISIILVYLYAKDQLHKNGIRKHDLYVCEIDKPSVFPGRVSHTRIFPKFHSFTYSYLMIGVPVTSLEQGNWILSVDTRAWWKRGWLHVDSDDHLLRGDSQKCLRKKLDTCLKQEVSDIRY